MELGKIRKPLSVYIKLTHSRSNQSIYFHSHESWLAEGYDHEDIEPKNGNFRMSTTPEGFDDFPQINVTKQSGGISNRPTNTFATYNPREMKINFHMYSQPYESSYRSAENLNDVISVHAGDVITVQIYFRDLNEGYLTYALPAEGQTISNGSLLLNDVNENLFYRYSLHENTGEVLMEYYDQRSLTVRANGASETFGGILKNIPLRIEIDSTGDDVEIVNNNNDNYCRRKSNNVGYFLCDSFLNWAGSSVNNWLITAPNNIKGQPIWLSPGVNRITFKSLDNSNPSYNVTLSKYYTFNTVPLSRILGQEGQ